MILHLVQTFLLKCVYRFGPPGRIFVGYHCHRVRRDWSSILFFARALQPEQEQSCELIPRFSSTFSPNPNCPHVSPSKRPPIVWHYSFRDESMTTAASRVCFMTSCCTSGWSESWSGPGRSRYRSPSSGLPNLARPAVMSCSTSSIGKTVEREQTHAHTPAQFF